MPNTIGTTSSNTSLAVTQLNRSLGSQQANLEKLATGYRINRGADDPAGLISGEQLKAALEVLDAESRSVARVNNVAATADGYLAEASTILRENEALNVQLANSAGLTQAERDVIQFQIDSNNQAASRIVSNATFNGQKLFNGDVTLTANSSASTSSSSSATQVALPNLSSINTDDLDALVSLRGEIGGFQSTTIESTINANAVARENTAAALSMIVDTNYAQTTAEAARLGVMVEAGVSVFTAANSNTKAIDLILG